MRKLGRQRENVQARAQQGMRLGMHRAQCVAGVVGHCLRHADEHVAQRVDGLGLVLVREFVVRPIRQQRLERVHGASWYAGRSA